MSEFISTIEHSHKANELERAMAGIFKDLTTEHLHDELTEIFDYGAPWQGSRTVVERFTKLNGLAVLRREDGGLSDKLMSIIYANWSALASERGLGFLQFVLDMLYPQQNEIIRLWHPKDSASKYPLYIKEDGGPDDFLTSRIRIRLDRSVDMAEISELTPILTRLVPWQVVPEIAVSFKSEDKGLQLTLALQRFHVANFSPF